MDNRFSERVLSLLKETGAHPQLISQDTGNYFQKAAANCENIIGTVSIPVGLAGPLVLKDDETLYAVPLATTEGCLVASINRGMKVIAQSGGAEIETDYVGITRAPVFKIDSHEQAHNAEAWFQGNFQKLAEETKKTSNYLELLKIETRLAGDYLFVKFFFDSKDAMGMNMATSASAHLIKTIITPELGITCLAVSGNYCCDKKPAAINILSGRGYSVRAAIEISNETIEKVLKTSAAEIFETYHAKIVIGSALAGSLGKNAHIANTIAAIFIATGQDPAQVVEGSLGQTIVELTPNGLEFEIYLPSLLCGVVGGGTALPKQHEALEIMGVTADPKNPGAAAKKFAEIIAATVLAGEISLLGALANNTLAQAHDNSRKQ